MCQHVKQDKRLIFHSPTVKELVRKTSHATGLTEMWILPFVNYTGEQGTVNEAIDRLALRSLLTLLNFAYDFMESQKGE